jgi:hypothetical protein
MVRDKVAGEHAALPAMIAVAMTADENPEIRTEDYAATMMAVQNICLAACRDWALARTSRRAP